MPDDEKTKAIASISKKEKDGFSRGKNYLLLIAIDEYEHCTRLQNCVSDAKAFQQQLISRYHFEDKDGSVVRLFNKDATRKGILDALKFLREKINAQPGSDNLLLYFSGHGAIDEDFGYWVPVDARQDEEDKFISVSDIKQRLEMIKSFHTLLIADACFAGSLFLSHRSDALIGLETLPSRWGITSSHSREYALDGSAGDNSPFAKCLVQALEANVGVLSVHALSDEVTGRVYRLTNGRQTPICRPLDVRGDDLGQFFFHVKKSEDAAFEKTKATQRDDEVISREEMRHQIRLEVQEEERQKSAAEAERLRREAEKQKEEEDRQRQRQRRRSLDPFFDLMVHVEGGSFDMGSNDGDENEKPIHQVKVKDFHLCKFPVTQAQWTEIMGENRSHFKGDDLPVENVSWDDAQEFMKKLNEQTSRRYRVPSEAEWEFAARGGVNSRGFKYPAGDEIEDVAWRKKNSGDKTHSVGQKKANELGLHDMGGNVWEWCKDVWHDNYNDAPTEGEAWTDGGDQTRRVRRGGSWENASKSCRPSRRSHRLAGGRGRTYGFRVALDE